MNQLISLFLLSLLSPHYYLTGKAEEPDSSSNPSDFIKESCKSTLYPVLCYQCLSIYAPTIPQTGREKHLAQAALEVSLSRARSASQFVSKLYGFSGLTSREKQAMKDCLYNMGDSVYQLSRSLKELGGMSQIPGANLYFSWHMSNVMTWVSAALTDDTTCLDGFSGSSIDADLKKSIQNKITDSAQVTSVALALVHRFAHKHRSVALSSTP